MMHERYRGKFISLDGDVFKLSILQDSALAFTVEELEFSGEPITISWDNTEKIEPIQGSQATIKLISVSDRQYIDLYAIATGSIRLDITRNGVKYWSGALDPELFEEPYSYEKNYVVTLTFSDFSILDRKKWSERGAMTMHQIVEKCLKTSGIDYAGIIYYISTRITSPSDYLPTDVSFNCDNFFDEKGEAMSYREVLDAILKPFALKILRKGSYAWIYDINYIYGMAATCIEWRGTDANLSVDKVYNNVTISYSPYGSEGMIAADVDHDSIPNPDSEEIVTYITLDRAPYIAYKTWLSTFADGGVSIGSGAKFYRIDPLFSGQAESGVAWTVTTPVAGSFINHLLRPSSTISGPVLTMPERPFISGGKNVHDKLVIKLDLLVDVRNNPFEPAGDDNGKGDYELMKSIGNIAWVPFMLSLKDDKGVALAHWENKIVCESNTMYMADSKWVDGPGKWGDAYLCWYEEDRDRNTGLGGWKSNKRAIGRYAGKVPAVYTSSYAEHGEYVNIPEQSGFLELSVGSGIKIADNTQYTNGLYDKIRWMLYKTPTIVVVDSSGKKIEQEDVEIFAFINKNAKEELKIDTVVGTLENQSFTARGQVYSTRTKEVIAKFTREGVTDTLERLLIGTIYSNHADRMNSLSGTAKLLPGFCVLSDASDPEKKYMITGEVQDLLYGTSEVTMIEIAKDRYTGIEYE